ncbi:MAG: ATP-binding protein [Bdellovibrionota bacterium]
MSFIVGPRQSGKTTLALEWLKKSRLSKEGHYYNCDLPDVRRRFRDGVGWMSALKRHHHRPLLIFDEIHKVRQWKRLLKGVFDQYRDDFQFVVTKSGRLDLFQRGGDSLAGRYDSYFLGPFTPGEIARCVPIDQLTVGGILGVDELDEDLILQWELLGGFPEPFLAGKEALARSWWRNYRIRVTEEDMRDLTRLESVDLMRQILDLLPGKVSSPLSLQSIREDVETSFATVKRYILSLNQLFMTFEVPPYAKKIHRAVKKERKLYFFHHPAVLDAGARFENMVAILLKRWISEQNEKAQGEFGLHYLRDQDRREVDFMLSLDGKPVLLIEVKRSDIQLSSSLRFYAEKLGITGLQVVRQPGVVIKKGNGLAVVSVHRLACALG